MFRLIKLLGTLAVLLSGLAFVGVRSPNDLKAMGAAVAAARKSVIKSGDAGMTCGALEKELVSTMNGPTMRAYVAKVGAAAQKDYTTLQRRGPMTGQTAATIAASLVPGGGFTRFAVAQATHIDDLATILPQLMRSQRLMQLAFTKQCPWITGAIPFTPPR